MLIIAKQVGKEKLIVARVLDDTALEPATDLAKGVILHNKSVKRVFIYLQARHAKPVCVRKVGLSWRGKIKIK